jgi:SWI/SNF-related matrix-associated actin-dependent regulator 1 of chromatin subfamily A
VVEEESGKRRGQDEADWMPLLDGMAEARAKMAAAKLPLAEELADEWEGPVVVWSAHVAPLRKLAEREGWATITGQDSFEDRAAAVEKFQKGELRGLACSIKAAGVGLTLTAGCRSIFLDRDWQAAANVQAEDRQVRIGQKNAVFVTVLVLDHPLDRRVEAVCDRKTTIAAEILGDARVGR